MNTFMENPENPITEVSEIDVLVFEPLVSVVMITYNHEKYLAQAIEGVLSQKTDFPVELIIGEDCSTDGTRALALAYQSRYPDRIRVRFPERNLGVMPNFIATLEAARGKYIALCEGDDYWCDDGKLKKQVAVLESHAVNSGVFHDAHQLQQKSGVSVLRIGHQMINQRPDVASIIKKMNIATASMLFRKIEFTARHRNLINSTRKGDYMLALIVAEHGPWQYLPEPMSVYRIHEGGVWSGVGWSDRASADIRFYEILLADEVFAQQRAYLNAKLKSALMEMATAKAINNEICASIKYFAKSIYIKGDIEVKQQSHFIYLKILLRQLMMKIKVWSVLNKMRKNVAFAFGNGNKK